MADVHVPAGWPEAVSPPGSEDLEATAVEWILSELVPGLRTSAIRRYPVALAVIARHVTSGAAEGARDGYKDEGRRLAAAAKGAELVERALRGTL